jgi:beta-glucosidase
LSKETFSDNDTIAVTVTVKNNSSIAGKEVIQLYVSDDYASLIPTGKSLKRFQKIDVPAKSEVSKTFYLNKTDFQFVGKEGDFIVEEGDFTIRVGNLSEKLSYKKK